jgi:uracil-DNA glycosylase
MAVFTRAKNSVFFHQSDWEMILYHEYSKPYFRRLEAEINRRLEEDPRRVLCPSPELVFQAFLECPSRRTKVVIVAQDPYPNKAQAEGTAFSVPSNTGEKNLPRTLVNIFREFRRDLKISPRVKLNPHLGSWGEQGVLLLNSILTTEEGNPGAHIGLGWERFTERIIKELSDREDPLVFCFLGARAAKFSKHVDARHGVLELPHPSPLSAHRGFYFSRMFSTINKMLQERGQPVVFWESICYKRYQEKDK